jgi:hypothetical protein
MGWDESALKEEWEKAVKKGHANDFVICITASSKTGVSGTGKTTLTTDLAKRTDLSEDGFDATEKASLDACEIAYERVPETELRSTIVWDEAQGAPGTVGLDARRAMKQEVIDSISSILANRDKQFTIIITAQAFSMIDPRVYPLIDAWLLIRKGPDAPDGPVGTYHKVHVEDYNLGNPTVKTPAIEDFGWNRVPHDDPDYQELERLKQMAKTQNYGESGDEQDGEEATPDISIEQRNKLLKERIKDDDVTESDLAATFGISRQRVNQIVNE